MSKRKRPFVKRIFICDEERFDLPFHYYGKLCFETEKFLRKPHLFSLVVLTGGADLTPAIYGNRQHPLCGETNAQRDAKDLMIAYTAIRCGIPIVGICRGAQLINIIAGGTLIQHCDNHRVWHNIRTDGGSTFEVSSTHHQMMILPQKKNYKLLAWANPSRTTKCFSNSAKKPHKAPELEPDCIWFPGLKALALQYHPEYMATGTEAFMYAQYLIENHIGLKKQDEEDRDVFISLPKRKQTVWEERIKAGIYKSLSKEGQLEFENREFMEYFLLNKVRKYQSQLMMEDTAIELAQKELEEILQAKQQGETVDALRASGASE